jgi:uncharacterized protein DUF5818
MKHSQFVFIALLFLAVMIVVCLAGPAALAQGFQQDGPKRLVPAQPYEQGAASEVQTFTGRIVKSGERLVLADLESQKAYQLDDQGKAQDFVNKNVKVAGVLDEPTGVIRIAWIEQA